MTFEEFDAWSRAEDKPVVLIPLGSQEIQGPMVPMGDFMLTREVAAEVALASGAARTPPGLQAVQAGIEAACATLARAIVEDGEGTTRVAEVTVAGAGTEDDAVGLARAITGSALLRAAVHGADPNWGRVLAAMGTSPVTFDPGRVQVRFQDVTVCRFGAPVVFERGNLAARMDRPVVTIDVDLGAGDASATMLTADLTPAYVAENAYYTT